MGIKYKFWSDEDIWKTWFLNRMGLSVRDISERIGRSKQSTSCKMSNEQLYYHPPKCELPENLEIELDGELFKIKQEDIMKIEIETGRVTA